MSQSPGVELFRQAAEAEGGMPVSAGARVGHLRRAMQTGRGMFVDLSRIPEDQRAAAIAEIKEVVRHWEVGNEMPQQNSNQSTGTAKAIG